MTMHASRCHSRWMSIYCKAGIGALAAFLWLTFPVHAQRMCAGTIEASLLQPLPAPMSVMLEQDMQDAVNPGLVNQFIAGLQEAGTQVGSQGSAVMSFTVEVQETGSGAGTAAGTFSNFDWVSGERLSLGERSQLLGTVLTVSVQVEDSASAALLSVVTLKCTMQTSDSSAMARELGREIGSALGKSFEQRTL